MTSPWSLAFPLPFRVQAIVGLGILGWATNLHGLNAMGIDVVGAMDLHVDAHQYHPLPTHPRPRPNAPALYRAIYRIAFLYSVWCFAFWYFFRLVTKNDPATADAFGFIPGVSTLCILIALISPFSTIEKQERDKFLSALRRCIFSSRRHAIYFSDVIYADVATSFAKVLGDVWLSLCMLLPGNTLLHTPHVSGWARLLAPTVMSLPYLIRFRQCIIEYMLPANDSQRPFFNAIKYATAFPVIYLSAAQRPRMHDDESLPWLSSTTLYRLWLLCAFVNSLYSFWWDVTNDWGLRLLKPSDSQESVRPSPLRRLVLSHRQSETPLLDDKNEPTAHPSNHNQGSYGGNSSSYPFGLRPVLLFPVPIYPMLIFVNLILRLTWSMKLSSHLHLIDRSKFVFYLELAEVIRRWMWVFLRVEWEIIKKTGKSEELKSLYDDPSHSDGDYEMITPPERGNAQFE